MSATILDRLIRDALFRELKPRMQVAIQSAIDAAFDEAWQAAITGLAPASGASPAESIAPSNTSEPVRQSASSIRVRPSSNVGKRAEWGTTRKVIQGAFASHGGVGMTPKAIADWGTANGQPVAASSVRTTLQKMQKAGEVRRRKDRYIPNSGAPTDGRGGDERPGAGPPASEDSRLNGSRMEATVPPP